MIQTEWIYRPRIKDATTWKLFKNLNHQFPYQIELWSIDTNGLRVYQGRIGSGVVDYEVERKRLINQLEAGRLPGWLETVSLDSRWWTHRAIMSIVDPGPSVRSYQRKYRNKIKCNSIHYVRRPSLIKRVWIAIINVFKAVIS